jgi:hypothetical protein
LIPHPQVTGVLQGIKGQYLILDTGVLNLRKFGGYEIMFGEKMSNPKTIYLKDYQAPLFVINEVKLQIDIFTDYTLVSSTLGYQPNNKQGKP